MPNPANSGRYQAALFDMDGVVTDTASIHASCWKSMFDEFLAKRTQGVEPFRPFDLDSDYANYVDGKPRYQGVRDFLKRTNLVRFTADEAKETLKGF